MAFRRNVVGVPVYPVVLNSQNSERMVNLRRLDQQGELPLFKNDGGGRVRCRDFVSGEACWDFVNEMVAMWWRSRYPGMAVRWGLGESGYLGGMGCAGDRPDSPRHSKGLNPGASGDVRAVSEVVVLASSGGVATVVQRGLARGRSLFMVG